MTALNCFLNVCTLGFIARLSLYVVACAQEAVRTYEPPLLYSSQFLNSTTLVHCPLVGQLLYCCTCVYLFVRALYKHRLKQIQWYDSDDHDNTRRVLYFYYDCFLKLSL